jgi:hypothetical protein
MGMWDQSNCDTCGGLRAWGHLAPPNPAVALDEDHPMDVGNRWGVLGAGATLRRVPSVFGNLGQVAPDENPPVDTSSTSGSIDSSDNGDAAVNPTISPVTANPGEPITAQSDPNAGNTSSGGSASSGGSPIVSTTDAGTSYLPWVIGGALVLGAGVAGAVYLRKRHLRRR